MTGGSPNRLSLRNRESRPGSPGFVNIFQLSTTVPVLFEFDCYRQGTVDALHLGREDNSNYMI